MSKVLGKTELGGLEEETPCLKSRSTIVWFPECIAD